MRDLDERVRYLIGESGPQLPTQEYEDRIEQELMYMKPADLLRWISHALEDAGVTFP